MKQAISEDSIKAATNCAHKFRCLHGAIEELCVPDHLLLGATKVLLVNPNNGSDCPYHAEYGNKDGCACPLRVELFKRYKV